MQHVRTFHGRRLGVAAVVALVVVGLAGGRAVAGWATVPAGPPPSIVYDFGVGNCDPVYSGSPCFGPPQVVHPGDTTDLVVTVAQDDPQPDGTIAVTWPANALTFVHNGDGSATCTATSHSVSCSYTDFAHGFKSDTFTFTVGPQTSPTVTAQITATTIDGTSQVANATLSFPTATYLRQQATPTVAVVGGSIGDVATLTGQGHPTGSITFRLYGPNTGNCSNKPAAASFTVPVNGAGSYSSPGFRPTYTGVYYWVATYSGDDANIGSSAPCGGMNGTVTVNQHR